MTEEPIPTIGSALDGSRWVAATALAATAIAADFAIVALVPVHAAELRWAIALVGVLGLTWLSRGDSRSLGLVGPNGGAGRWVGISVGLGLLVGLLLGVLGGLVLLSGGTIKVYRLPPDAAGEAFVRMCLLAPLLEESLYRMVLCVPLASRLAPRWAILVSGCLFGSLHVVYRNPSPENLAGGFLLAWAYLASGCLAVPIVMHAVGNLFALAGQLAAWRWLAAS